MNACATHGQFAAWMNQCPKCLIGAKAAPEPAKPLPVKVESSPFEKKIYKRRAEMTQLVIPLRRNELENFRIAAKARGLRPATWGRLVLTEEANK